VRRAWRRDPCRVSVPMAVVTSPPPAVRVGFTRTQLLGLVLGPLVLLFFVAIPPVEPITELGMSRTGLLAFAVVWWVTMPVPLAVTTLTALAIGVIMGALTSDQAFAPPNNWVIWFTIGAFGLGAALDATGFNRRFALTLLSLPWVKGQPHRFLFMFLLSATLLSGIVANTVVTVVWLSLAITIYRSLNIEKGHSFAELNTLTICWGANIGGASTPVGTGSNPVALAMIATATGTTLTFLQWTMVGFPIALVLAGSTYFVLRYVASADTSAFERPETMELIESERRKLGPMPSPERRALMWMGVAVGLWLIPDMARFLASPETAAEVASRFGLVVPALLIPMAMCLTPSGDPARPYVLTWQDWAKGVDWGMVIFLGGIMAIGAAVGAAETGLPEFLRVTLEPTAAGLPEYIFVFVLTLGVILVTSAISNLVSLTIFMPLGLTLSESLGIGSPLALGLILAIGPSLAYLLPSGTTTNAIIAGSGYLRVSTMLRLGIVMVVLHAFLLTVIGYPFAKLLLVGW
jgi:solute carrier family 13 (sodium-dependent dicarboxylate transporter), member 2/3/5